MPWAWVGCVKGYRGRQIALILRFGALGWPRPLQISRHNSLTSLTSVRRRAAPRSRTELGKNVFLNFDLRYLHDGLIESTARNGYPVVHFVSSVESRRTARWRPPLPRHGRSRETYRKSLNRP